MIYPLTGFHRPFSKKYELVKKRGDVTLWEIAFKGLSSIRGRTIATMVRRKAVIDWSPPKSLMAFEDYHLTQHILQKGYLVIQINKPLALHAPGLTANLRRLINKTAWNGAGIRTTKAMKPSELIVYLLGRTIQGLLPGQYPTLRYAGYKNQIIYIASLCGYIIGYAVPHKYLIPER
jgi:hypothetical protein